MTNSPIQLYNAVNKAIVDLSSMIVLNKEYTPEEVRAAFREVLRNHPQYFWYSYLYNYEPNTLKIHIDYTFSKERIAIIQKEINEVIENDFRLSYVKTFSQAEQVMYIYRWLLHYTNYNLSSAFNQTIYSVFIKRNSVCTGYAKAAQYLCHILGIECHLAFGQFLHDEENGRHCWNIVKIDGSYYHLDVCLGEPGLLRRLCSETIHMVESCKGIAYNCFCVSTDEICKTRRIEDKDTLPFCGNRLNFVKLLHIELLNSARPDHLGCKIASGTTSDIYLCLTDKHTVVKRVKPQYKVLADNERKCFSMLNGCKYVLQGEDGTNCDIYVEQATPLIDLLCSHYYKLTLRGAVHIIQDTVRALQECNERGIMYRDLHIANVYRGDDGRYKLGDFGHGAINHPLPQYDDKVGNEWFMSPETYKTGIFDVSSQLYSVTILFYFLLNNNHPPLGTKNFSTNAIIKRMNNCSIKPPYALSLVKDAHLRHTLEGFFSNGLNDHQKFRPQSYEDYLNILESILSIIKEDIIVLQNGNIKVEFNCETIKRTSSNSSGADAFIIPNTHNAEKASPMATFNMDSIEQFARTALVPSDRPADTEVATLPKIRCPQCGYLIPIDIQYCPNCNYSLYKTSTHAKTHNCHPNRCTEASYKNLKKEESYIPSSKVFSPTSAKAFWQRLFHHKPKNDYVNSCVYAPAEAQRNSKMLVQVFVYKEDERQHVQAKALVVDKNTTLRNYIPLEMKIRKGDTVKISLCFEDAAIVKQGKQFVWQGQYKSCEFSVFIPKDYSFDELYGKVYIFINDVPVGEMAFITNLTSHAPHNAFAEIVSNLFKRVFLSYSSKDRKTVKKIAEIFKINNIDYFYDRHTLKAGDKYREEIRKWIELSDLFVLCWSQHSAASKEVAKEKTIAIEVSNRENSMLRIYPLSIKPETSLPDDMVEIYNFGEIHSISE